MHKAKEVRAPGRKGFRLQAWTQGYRMPVRQTSGSDFCPLTVPHAPQGTAERSLSQVRRYRGPVSTGRGSGDSLPDPRLGWWTPLPARGDEPGRGTGWGLAWLQTPGVITHWEQMDLGLQTPSQADGKGEPLQEPRGGREPGKRRPGSQPSGDAFSEGLGKSRGGGVLGSQGLSSLGLSGSGHARHCGSETTRPQGKTIFLGGVS